MADLIQNVCRIVGHATPDGVVCSRCRRGIPELVLTEVTNRYIGYKVSSQTMEAMKREIIVAFNFYEIPCDNLNLALKYNTIDIKFNSGDKTITGGTL